MKEKRKREELEEKERRNKILQWSDEKRKQEEFKVEISSMKSNIQFVELAS